MKRSVGARVLVAVAVAGTLAFTGSPAMAAGSSNYVCAGGDIPSGTYASLTVTGQCSVPDGAVINVTGNINVASGAMLDAQSAPSTITVGHNVTAAAGSLLGLGCQPPSYTHNSGHECAINPEGHSTITVKGNVTTTDTAATLLNGITVNGNVTLTGGGSPIPWSIKNNTIGRNLTVSGQSTEWLGVLFNTIAGNVTLTNIAIHDEHPDAPGVYIVRNTVGKNLNCSGLTPGVSGGFVPGSVNVVGRNATGQCAPLV